MKHAFPILFLIVLGAPCLRAQGYQPINAFHPEKDYPGSKFQSAENLSPTELIRQVLSDFELSQKQMIAILVNGKYEARVHGNGDFDQDKVPQRLNDKIVLVATERVEARFNLNYNDPWASMPYTGTINFVIPALTNPNLDPNAPEPDPEPWENPMTKRLLAAQEPDVRLKRQPASTATRYGIFAGSQLRAQSIYLGIPVEVPITRQLYLCSSIMWNRKSNELVETDSTGFQKVSSNLEIAMEVNIGAKYYLNNSYPRFYLFAGPYLERDRLKKSYFEDPEPGKFGKAHTALGINGGLGMLVFAGLNVSVGWSTILTRHDKLLPYQDLRGTSISVGWMFGKR
ncbi:MAG: hypothetical protein H7246_03195 [Phycisphaerae bacterium]|nr:hypothetical protein [Saprospiraceae bacterium]